MTNAVIHESNSFGIDESLRRGRAILEDAEKYLSFFENCFGVTSPLNVKSKKNTNNSNCINTSRKSDSEHQIQSIKLREEKTSSIQDLSGRESFNTSLNIDSDKVCLDARIDLSCDLNERQELLPEKNDDDDGDEEVRNAIAYLRDIRLDACKSFFNDKNDNEKKFDFVKEKQLLTSTNVHNIIDFSNRGKVYYYEEESSNNAVLKTEIKRKFVKAFDPSKELEVLKRASIRAAKRAEVEAALQAEEKEANKFKALPLPNGVQVMNNPYALTKSAMNRQQKINEKANDEKVERLRKSPNPNVRKMSVRSENVIKEVFFNYNLEEPYLELSRPVDFYLNKEAADEVDFIEFLKNMGEFDSCSLADLHQKNGKLHALLTEKRRQCQDLNRLISHELSLIKTIKSYSLFDHDKKNFILENETDKSEEKDNDVFTGLLCAEEKSDKKKIDDIHRRQEKWRLEKQAKIDSAREQQIKDSMAQNTGKPQITSKKSWETARMKHDHALSSENNDPTTSIVVTNQAVSEDEEEKQKFLLLKRKENENRKKSSTVKRTIKKQKGALEKLAQPRLNCSVDKKKLAASKSELEEGLENDKQEKEQTCEETNDDSQKVSPKIDFHNMNDKQFSNILKSMGLGTMPIKKKKNMNNCKNPFTDQNNTANYDNQKATPMVSKSEQKIDQGNKRDKAKLNDNQTEGKNSSSSKKSALDHDANKKSCESKKLEALGIYSTEARPKKPNTEKESEESNKINETNTACVQNESIDRSASPSTTSVMRDTIQRYNNSLKKLEPYEMYESGKCTSFFDKNSSTLDKGRFRVRDARSFAPESMRRRKDPECSNDSIMFLVGKRLANEKDKISKDDQDLENLEMMEEEVITIIFDRSEFSEKEALDWWNENRRRFI